MQRQGSFSQAEYAGKKKQTRRDKFLVEMELMVPPAFVLCLGRLARRCAAVASCRVVEGAPVAARPSAARPGSPQEGPARPHRDLRESGGAARGRSLWTHRGERPGEAWAAPQQAARGE